ncbi:hypothetical protein IAQ61_005278 [Plenodomus lingam]|uniref:uncharacterized protein n=1 Tax=Leptosphaeria maculans TaxID=5022 RepID=UPI00332E52EF|nr:hypothetical protein IAQ61_005278 [Plenodomus lingam]
MDFDERRGRQSDHSPLFQRTDLTLPYSILCIPKPLDVKSLRVLAPRHERNLYCGTEKDVDHAFASCTAIGRTGSTDVLVLYHTTGQFGNRRVSNITGVLSIGYLASLQL